EVGGLWDNMLADGRKFFNFASSDFHSDSGADFWPGEYLKTYIKVKDLNNDGNYTQDEVLTGMRSGNAYSVHGDMISDLDYKVIFKTPFGNKSATMGETLYVKKGNKVTVQIRFKAPATNNCQAGVNASANFVCPAPSVHHVQLIQGKVNAATKPSKLIGNDPTKPNAAFNTTDTTVASVVATFDNDQNSANPKWTTDAQGYTVISYEVPNVQNDMFFRIRGSNLGYDVKKMSGTSVVYGTDAVGNPLKNTPGTNSADMAWEDLWFYSNPIFVSTAAPTQFVYTSDSHYGISRTTAIANGAKDAQPVNKALVATINALPTITTPCDGGVNSCATAVNSIDFVANTGDIANRMETGIQSAAASWAQFNTDYILGLNVKGANGVKAPLYLAPGNHDVTNAVGFYKAMSPLFDATSYVNIYNVMLGGSLTNTGFIGTSAADAAASYAANKVYYSKDINGVHFVFLGMWPDSAARTWMDSDLSGVSSTTPVVLFTHDQPDIETKHLMNPNGNHTINSTDKFENLVYGENSGYATATSTSGSSAPEQTALVNWLKNHKNIVAYFHGNSNKNEFYTFAGPNSDISLNTFRVDSPMKGDISATNPNVLSYQVISIDPAATQMTVREYLWNTKTWGASKTVPLTPRAN
ncbi:MAG: metallophosphoesterase, partial [Pedobacter sp.]